MTSTEITFGRLDWIMGKKENLLVDSLGGLAIKGLSALDEDNLGYLNLTTGKTEYIPRYPAASTARMPTKIAFALSGESIELGIGDVEVRDIPRGEEIRSEKKGVPKDLIPHGVLNVDSYFVIGGAPTETVEISSQKMRISIDGFPLVVTDPDQIETSFSDGEPPPPERTYSRNPRGYSGTSGDIREITQKDESVYQESYGVSKKIFKDKRSGIEMAPAVWIDREVWVPAKWTMGPIRENHSVVIENFGEELLAVYKMTVYDPDYRKLYTFRVRPELSIGSAEEKTGTWEGLVKELPSNTISLAPQRKQYYKGKYQSGRVIWEETRLPSGSLGIAYYDKSGATIKNIDNWTGGSVPNNAKYYRLLIKLRSKEQVSLKTLVLQAEVKALSFEEAAPPIRPGVPTRGSWDDEEHTLRCQPSSVVMPKHPLHPSGSSFSCWANGSNLGGGNWLTPSHISVPDGTQRVYFSPEAEVSEVGGRNAPTTTGRWGAVESKLETYQLYNPDLKVELFDANSSNSYDITDEVTSLSRNNIRLVGDFRPDVEVVLEQAGSGIQVTVDGLPVMYGKVTGASREAYSAGRIITILWSDPLDYHNVDMEQISEARSSKIPKNLSPLSPFPIGSFIPSRSLLLPFFPLFPLLFPWFKKERPINSELKYLQEISEGAGVMGLTKDSNLFTRSTAFWTASPDKFGYGGTVDDYENAYAGQGGTLTQELELVANANLGTVVSGSSAAQQALVVPMLPRWQDTLSGVMKRLLEDDNRDGYVYNIVKEKKEDKDKKEEGKEGGEENENKDAKKDTGITYLPDTRLSLPSAGFDQMKGYALVCLEGQSNVFSSTISTQPAKIKVNKTLSTEIVWKHEDEGNLLGFFFPISGLFQKRRDLDISEFRIFASENGQAYYKVTDNGIPSEQLEHLFPNWKEVGDASVDNDHAVMAGEYSSSGVWAVDSEEFYKYGKEDIKIIYDPEDKGFRKVIADKHSFIPGQRKNLYIDGVEFLVESPKRLMAKMPDSAINIRNVGPCITGARIRIIRRGKKSGLTVEFALRIFLKGMSEEGMRVVPYSSEPSGDYAPNWYPGFVKEARQSFTKRMQKKNTVQNPFVVEILPGEFPDGTAPREFEYPVEARVIKKDEGEDEEEAWEEGEETRENRPNYQAGAHVSTAMNLWEWLRTRSSTIEYAGAPSWRPGQFIAVARRPEDGIGAPVSQFDVFLVLEPSGLNISVGGEITTSCEAGYIGAVDIATGAFNNYSPMRFDLFREMTIESAPSDVNLGGNTPIGGDESIQ